MSDHPLSADGTPDPGDTSARDGTPVPDGSPVRDGTPVPDGSPVRDGSPAADGVPSAPDLGLSAPTTGPDGVCITCSDQADVAEVIEVVDAHTVQARTAAGLQAVDTTLLADVHVGDRVLVHAGTAISDLPDTADLEGNP